MAEDEQVSTSEPIAPEAGSEEATEPAADLGPTLAIIGEAGPETIVPVDPFFGYYANNATLIEGTWAGLPNFECSMCGFASLDRERAEAHLSIHGQTFTQGARP